MSNRSARFLGFPVFRRFWKPALATGAGGAAVIFWLDEIVIFGKEILTLITLSVMAGVIYLLDNCMFRSQMPRREDMKEPDDHGVKK